jgi:hypothetical protein
LLSTRRAVFVVPVKTLQAGVKISDFTINNIGDCLTALRLLVVGVVLRLALRALARGSVNDTVVDDSKGVGNALTFFKVIPIVALRTLDGILVFLAVLNLNRLALSVYDVITVLELHVGNVALVLLDVGLREQVVDVTVFVRHGAIFTLVTV